MAKRRPSGDGMVCKRSNGRWEGRIVVGHKQDGSPLFRYVYADTQREVLDKLHERITEYRDAELTEDSRMTLGQRLDKWADEYMTGTVRESTLTGYRGYIRNYIKPRLGGKQVSAVTKSDVQRLYSSLKKNGRVHEHPVHGKALSDAMIMRVHCVLHLAMEKAKELHLIVKNPTVGVTVPKAESNAMKVLTSDELEAFLAEADKDELWRDFFYTELTTGLCRGEICALQWKDFDEGSGKLHVCRSVGACKHGVMPIGETKTDEGDRVISLPPSTAQRLRERKKDSVSQWIFPNLLKPEEPLEPSSAYRKLKILLKQAGVSDIRFHDLRHTFATHALTSGVDPKTLANILGHVNASFTLDRYTHVTGDMQEKAAEVVGEFMTEIFGKELKPWQSEESQAMEVSA